VLPDGRPFVNEHGNRYLLSTHTNEIKIYWIQHTTKSKSHVVDEKFKERTLFLPFGKNKNGEIWSDDEGNLYEECLVICGYLFANVFLVLKYSKELGSIHS
jgi:hypothetical protein